jgi:hypothetical protein
VGLFKIGHSDLTHLIRLAADHGALVEQAQRQSSLRFLGDALIGREALREMGVSETRN